VTDSKLTCSACGRYNGSVLLVSLFFIPRRLLVMLKDKRDHEQRLAGLRRCVAAGWTAPVALCTHLRVVGWMYQRWRHGRANVDDMMGMCGVRRRGEGDKSSGSARSQAGSRSRNASGGVVSDAHGPSFTLCRCGLLVLGAAQVQPA
jgi:hypothetical protein